MPKPPLSPPAAPSWRRSGRAVEMVPAALSGYAGRVHVDLAAPSAGLITSDGDRLLGLDVGADVEPADAWVRGPDLTACWEPHDERELRATALWRCHPCGSRLGPPPGVSAWELVASATSRRLHADATLTVTNDVAARGVLASRLEAGCADAFSAPGDPRQALFVIRRGGGTSVAIIIHPADLHGATVTSQSHRALVRCRLFVSGVEKGVLLRSRILAALGPAEGDLEWIVPLAERFASSPPELST